MSKSSTNSNVQTKLLIYISSDIIFGEIQQIRNNINCDCKFIFLQQDFMIIRYYLVMKLYINDQYFPMKSFLLEKSANTISMIDVMTSSSHMVKLYYITREDN